MSRPRTEAECREIAARMFLATCATTILIAAVRPRALPPLALGLFAGYSVGAASGIGFKDVHRD